MPVRVQGLPWLVVQLEPRWRRGELKLPVCLHGRPRDSELPRSKQRVREGERLALALLVIHIR